MKSLSFGITFLLTVLFTLRSGDISIGQWSKSAPKIEEVSDYKLEVLIDSTKEYIESYQENFDTIYKNDEIIRDQENIIAKQNYIIDSLILLNKLRENEDTFLVTTDGNN